MKLHTAALVTVLAASSLAGAQMKKRAVSPEKASEGSTRLVSEIKWLGVSGDDGAVQAELTREAKADGKLIFYMHMLGNIAGNT